MAPSRVVVGLLASQYGVVWAVWIRGVVVGLSLSVPSLARVLAISFPDFQSVHVLYGCESCVESIIP